MTSHLSASWVDLEDYTRPVEVLAGTISAVLAVGGSQMGIGGFVVFVVCPEVLSASLTRVDRCLSQIEGPTHRLSFGSPNRAPRVPCIPS